MGLTTGQRVEKLWGSGENNIWGVGPKGTIVHFDGTNWSKIDFDTGWYFYSVSGDPATGIAYAQGKKSDNTIIVKLSASGVSELYNNETKPTWPNSWTSEYISDNRVLLADNQIWSYTVDSDTFAIEYKMELGSAIASICKASKNDIYFFGTRIGDIGIWYHYNGARYKEFSLPKISYNYGGSYAVKNLAAYVGFSDNKAIITIIRRTN